MIVDDLQGVDHLGGKGVHRQRYKAWAGSFEIESEKVFGLNELAFEVFSHLLFLMFDGMRLPSDERVINILDEEAFFIIV